MDKTWIKKEAQAGIVPKLNIEEPLETNLKMKLPTPLTSSSSRMLRILATWLKQDDWSSAEVRKAKVE